MALLSPLFALVAFLLFAALVKISWGRRVREHRRQSRSNLEAALADYLKGIPLDNSPRQPESETKRQA